MTSRAPFEKTIAVRWCDLDANGHLRNAAYLDLCVDVRFAWFAENGFTPDDFRSAGIGPVIFRDEIEYRRELRLFDRARVTHAFSGAAEDGSHFRIVNEYVREDGGLAARVVATGAWLDLASRRLVPPPAELAALVLAAPRTADFEILPPRGRR